jgi:hypothetical protein
MTTTRHPRHAGAVLSAPDAADPDAWESRSVPILPESEQDVELRDPATKKILLDENGKKKTRPVRFDEARLRGIADEANARAARGHFCPVQIGHTILWEPDETLQPEPVGFMRNFRVGPILDHQGRVIDPTPHLIADQVIRSDKLDRAHSYPHRSPELDASRMTLDSLALIRRPPKYDMGLIMNARDSDLEPDREPEAGDVPAGPNPPPDGGEPESPTEGETAMPETMNDAGTESGDKVLPLVLEALHAIMGKLGIGAEGEPEPPAEGELQNADVTPGADSVLAPGLEKEDDDQIQNCDRDKQLIQNQRLLATENRGLKAELAALRREFDAQQDEVGELMVQNARQSVEQAIEGLEAEGVDLKDREAFRKRLLGCPGERERTAEVEHAKLHFSRIPIGERPIATARGGKPDAAAGALDRGQLNLIAAYASKHGLKFPAAKAKCLAEGVI